MRRSSILVRAGQSLVLGGIPALALIWFGPAACTVTDRSAVAPWRPLAATVASGVNHGADTDLRAWQETASPAAILVAEARRNSAALNNAVRGLRSELRSQNSGTLDSALTLQSLLLAAAQRDAWDSNWRQMARKGANLHLLSRRMLNLRIQFVAANASLQSVQAKERAAASVFSFTPPVF
jgi:hypothetical protein